jgi:Tfp pilus assembly protein PilE
MNEEEYQQTIKKFQAMAEQAALLHTAKHVNKYVNLQVNSTSTLSMIY